MLQVPQNSTAPRISVNDLDVTPGRGQGRVSNGPMLVDLDGSGDHKHNDVTYSPDVGTVKTEIMNGKVCTIWNTSELHRVLYFGDALRGISGVHSHLMSHAASC